MKQSVFHSYRISDLSLKVRLGCSTEERSKPQEIRVTLDLRFRSAPIGATSDQLQDTICYVDLSRALRNHVEQNEFQLLEKLTHDFYELLSGFISEHAELAIEVHKVLPPELGFLGGVRYRIGSLS